MTDRPLSAPRPPAIGIIVPRLTNPIFSTGTHHLQDERLSRAGGISLIRTQTPGAAIRPPFFPPRPSCERPHFRVGRHRDLLADLGRYFDVTQRSIPFVTINGAHTAPTSTGDALGIPRGVAHHGGRTHRPLGGPHPTCSSQIMGELVGDQTFYTYEAGSVAMVGIDAPDSGKSIWIRIGAETRRLLLVDCRLDRHLVIGFRATPSTNLLIGLTNNHPPVVHDHFAMC